MFERLHGHLCENGSFIASSDARTGTRTVRHPNMEETILNIVNETPTTIIRAIARRVHHDGAPADFKVAVRNNLDASFEGRWIGRGRPVRWTPRSPDLSSIDYFLWVHLKVIVYETPVNSVEDLVVRLSSATASARESPVI
ncbi:hypothetical protein AVEN_201844-1, partial [Araneus ventricosus]